MERNKNKIALTTIGVDQTTNRKIDKLCKRYNLKKGEIVKFAFEYMDKACINPSEPPESAKAELAKINKRQDDLVRFIRHFEEKELNPMIRATHSIATKFDLVVNNLSEKIDTEINSSRELQDNVLKRVKEAFDQHAGLINKQAQVINSSTQSINTLRQTYERDSEKFLKVLYLYSKLASCGVMDGKRKENLKAEIIELINSA